MTHPRRLAFCIQTSLLAALLPAAAVPASASQLFYVLTDALSHASNSSTIIGSAEQIYNTNAGATANLTNIGGATLTNLGTANILGLTAGFAQTSAAAGDSSSASAYAAADLAAGTLKAAAANGGNSGATSTAQFDDTLTFNVPGASVQNPGFIGISFVLHGVESAGVNGTISEEASILFGSAQVDAQWSSSQVPFLKTNIGWATENVIQLDKGNFLFTGTIAVTNPNPVETITESLILSCAVSDGCSEDYSHTATTSLMLAQGTGYTSASGVFLSAPVTATPEPSTFAPGLLGLGVAGVVWTRRRRRL
jgi:MYXO-CTERM domain-containing protein